MIKEKKSLKGKSPSRRKFFKAAAATGVAAVCLLYTSPSPRDAHESRMPSSA